MCLITCVHTTLLRHIFPGGKYASKKKVCVNTCTHTHIPICISTSNWKKKNLSQPPLGVLLRGYASQNRMCFCVCVNVYTRKYIYIYIKARQWSIHSQKCLATVFFGIKYEWDWELCVYIYTHIYKLYIKTHQ